MTYIREYTKTERFPDQYKRIDNEVYERKLAQAFKFTTHSNEAVATLTQASLHQWRETAIGKFVIEHGKDTFFIKEQLIDDHFKYKMAIVTYMTPKRWTEFHLKFANESTVF